MLGKYAACFGFSAAVIFAGVFDGGNGKHTSRSATLVAPEFFDSVKEPDVSSRLKAALAAFEGEPSPTMAMAVLDALATFDRQLAELRQRAGNSTGGLRAELEIRRIELERERDLQLQRFYGTHEKTRFDLQTGRRNDLMQFASSTVGGLSD